MRFCMAVPWSTLILSKIRNVRPGDQHQRCVVENGYGIALLVDLQSQVSVEMHYARTQGERRKNFWLCTRIKE